MRFLSRFELFIAGRYLRAKRKQAVISVITIISIAGVAAGVMALVIALAINNGFRNTLQRNLLGATAHVSILEKQPGSGIENWRAIEARLRSNSARHCSKPGAVRHGDVQRSPNVIGRCDQGYSCRWYCRRKCCST